MMSGLVMRGMKPRSLSITPFMPFDIKPLLSLQNQLRMQKMNSPLPPIVTKANVSSKTKANLSTHSIYDLSKLPNEVPKNTPKIDAEDKLTTSSLYDVSNSTGLSQFLQFELDYSIKKAVVTFDENFLTCPVCQKVHYKRMASAINKMYAELQMEMYSTEPMMVTQAKVDGWLEIFQQVHMAYEQELRASGHVCEGAVEQKAEVREGWIWKDSEQQELIWGTSAC
jgi:hypothetical protein